MSDRPRDDVWKSADLVRTFLENVRGGIPYAADQIAIMLQAIEATALPIRRFLDLGSGSGALAAALLDRYPDAEAVLVDFSEPMLEAARQKFPSPPHHLVLADFGRPDWVDAVEASGPFDAIVSGYAIHHQPDERKRTLFAEIFTLLTPGGAFVDVEHVAPASPWVSAMSDELFIETIHAHHRRHGRETTRDQVARDYVHRPDKAANILASVEVQCDWLREIGFIDVDCYFKVFELAVFGGRRPTA
jgi:tRNA (cmo5U34)-methyltransferase